MRVLLATAFSFTLGTAFAHADEVRCNEEIGKAVSSLQRSYLVRFDRCLKFGNFLDCPSGDLFSGIVQTAAVKLENRVTAKCGPVVAGGTPISAFGPAVCPASWKTCDAPITTTGGLVACFQCVLEGLDVRHRDAVDLPPVPENQEERTCITHVHRALSKAIKAGLGDVRRCAAGGVKPFSCPVAPSPGTDLAQALDGIARVAGRCRDAGGTRGAVSGAVQQLCHKAVVSPDDVAECLVQQALCSTCWLSNVMYGQSQDCAAVSGDRTCIGRVTTAAPGMAFVANQDDDSVTHFGIGAGYRFATLAGSTFPAGDAPSAIAGNGNTDLLYVASRTSSTVTYLDASTGSYMDGTLMGSSFAVGAAPSALAVADELGIVYVANAGDGTVTFLDASDGSYVYGTLAASSFPAGAAPSALTLDDAQSLLYVANAADGTVAFLDPITGQPLFGTLAASTFATGAGAAGVAHDAHNDRILVTNRLDDTVTLFDGATGTPAFGTLAASTFAAGDAPGAAVWANGAFFFVAEGDETINAMNHRGEIDTLPSGPVPRALAALDGFDKLYLAEDGNDELAVVGDGDGLAGASFEVGAEPRAIAVSPSATLVYVVNEDDDTVSFLDAATGAYANGTLAASTFALSVGAHELAVNETAGILYIANDEDGTVTYMGASTGAYVNGTLAASTFAVGSRPRGLAVDPAANLLYVSNFNDSTVTYLNATTGAPAFGNLAASTFGVANFPRGIAVNPGANLLYVASSYDSTITFLDASTGAYANGTLANSSFDVGEFGARELALDAAANRLFVLGPHQVVFLDAATGMPAIGNLAASTFDTVYAAVDMALEPATKRLILSANAGIIGPAQEPVVFLDSETGAFLGTTMVGVDPIGVAVNSAAGIAYVSTLADDSVTFLDSLRPGLFAIADVGFSAHEASSVVLYRNAFGVAFNGNEGIFYPLADFGNFFEGVYFIDAATATYFYNYGDVSSSTFYLTTYETLHDIAYNAATGLLYVTKSTQGTNEYGLSVLDGFTKAFIGTFLVGEDPEGVATSATDDVTYVAAFGDDAVTLLDASTLAYLYGDLASSQIPVGDGPIDVAVNETAGIAYLANQNAATVTYLDAATGAYLNGTLAASTFAVLATPTAVAVDPGTSTLYVTCADADAVVMLDATTGAYAFGTLSASTLAVGDFPFAAAVNESTGTVYVVNRVDETVTYINGATGAYLHGTLADSTFAVGPYPWGIAVDAADDVVAITTTALDTYNHPAALVFLDGTTGELAFAAKAAKLRIPTSAGPSAVAVMTPRR